MKRVVPWVETKADEMVGHWAGLKADELADLRAVWWAVLSAWTKVVMLVDALDLTKAVQTASLKAEK